jgi:hypothetical protein
MRTKQEGGVPEMKLSEKAKTFEVPMQQCLSCGDIIPDTHEDAVSHSRAKHDVITNFRQIKVSMVLVSVAQQEIDKLKTFRDNAYKKWCDSQAELERERGLLKQKLQEKAIRLLMLRAGGRYRMFEAGMLYQCLVLLGMQEFTRHEQVNTLEKTTCHYLHESDAKKQLEELLK